MTPVYAAKLDFSIWKTNVRAEKIDILLLEIYDMALTRFLLQDSLKKVRFFEKTFLLTNTSMKIVLKMHFLALINANFQFGVEKLI